MSEVTLGGDRLGSGKQQKVYLHNYERSSHDLGYIWRSSMSAGTLVPFMVEVALPGDTFDIRLNADIKTLPTVGPLFGSYKVQLDVFQVPIRCYQGKLHMNKLGIGLDMNKIKLPYMLMEATTPPINANIDNYQINPSSIFSYLNIRGLGYTLNEEAKLKVERNFNAIPYLAYFDIFKNYYSNKQEEVGYIIHNTLISDDAVIVSAEASQGALNFTLTDQFAPDESFTIPTLNDTFKVVFTYSSITNFNPDAYNMGWNGLNKLCTEIFSTYVQDPIAQTITFANPYPYWGGTFKIGNYFTFSLPTSDNNTIPNLYEFDLADIDSMREWLLTQTSNPNALNILDSALKPYTLPHESIGEYEAGNYNAVVYSKNSAQEGLLVKTYQSDLFNNWISTEWLDGTNGINEITAVDTSSGMFTIDTLNLSRKVYDMLNRIAVSGGTYDDWLDATYTHERSKSIENPVYCGGLSKELTFEEIFSQSTAEGQPLGTLAGKGRMTDKHKGGDIKIRVDEPSYIMGIISLTPRIDYSQGNKWDVNLETMNDFHKPALDEIGFQDLITDQMAWFDTGINPDGSLDYKSAGKQPAWINYMTNVNQVRGDFAEVNNEMFMVLNRRYDNGVSGANGDESPTWKIGDLTTYIDPSKFNFIFAETKLNAMNFWAQVKCDITARRKMSAKIMPNL